MRSLWNWGKKVAIATLLCGYVSGYQVPPSLGQSRLYSPLPLPLNQELSDTLTERDIPTGQGGFARDYLVSLQAGDQLAIEAKSDTFDVMVSLLAADGSTIAENDDGTEGDSNALVFTRIQQSGQYIVRVRGFGISAVGSFQLQVTRLKPA